MVFVKVRETYDLHTVKNKMTVIGIHTPKPDIIKANFPGLLMQCKAYRPVSCDVRMACASTLPLDPLGVGTAEGDVAPEDLFNPILYKACSNFGMSQLEARINAMSLTGSGTSDTDVNGQSVVADVDTVTPLTDDFPVYYGLLSNAHEFRHANPQAGLEMTGLKPLVYEMLYAVGDGYPLSGAGGGEAGVSLIDSNGGRSQVLTSNIPAIRGNSKPLPFMNCTSYTANAAGTSGLIDTGFQVAVGSSNVRIQNAESDVPWINCLCGCIIVPPSRLHELFYRLVCEWTIEFSAIRPLSEVVNWSGLSQFADITHYQNYSYENTKKVLTGSDESVLDHNDACMVSANVDVNKVM